MIFVTVGSAEPFDRLIRAVDQWAGARSRQDVFAQIGEAGYVPAHIEYLRFLSPKEFRERVDEARLIVAHAGMGSIITALEARKPILVMPRREHLGETRNDHQVATVEHFAQGRHIMVAWDEKELVFKLDAGASPAGGEILGPEVSPTLISAISEFISSATSPVSKTESPARASAKRLVDHD